MPNYSSNIPLHRKVASLGFLSGAQVVLVSGNTHDAKREAAAIAALTKGANASDFEVIKPHGVAEAFERIKASGRRVAFVPLDKQSVRAVTAATA